jgi:putative oxidoreductase
MKNLSKVLVWSARIIAAVIMLQTLYFKFTGASESIEIFTTIDMEPWGRIGVGIMELLASVLLLINATAWLGAALGAGLMGGAIFMHLTILGISIQNDGGYLFGLAVVVLVCCMVVLYMNKAKLLLLWRTVS